MDPFSEASDRDVNDSRWLDAETMALAEGIAESVANGSPLPESAPSSDVTVSTSSAPSIGASQEPSIKFGARVKASYDGTEYSYLVGRTEPAALPQAVLKMLTSMRVGDTKLVPVSASNSSETTSRVTSSEEDSPSVHTSRDDESAPTSSDSVEAKELILLEIEEFEHVVSGGSILKRPIYCPEETKHDKHTPTFETIVTVDLVGRIEATNEIFDERLNADFRVGEGELGLGMERAIRSMHRGEKAEFTFLPPWPVSLCPNPKKIEGLDLKTTPVVYEVTLKSFVDAKTPFECHSYADHLHEATMRKEQGNAAHEAKKFSLAVTKWTKAQLFLEQFNDFASDTEAHTYAQLKVLLALNLAAANLRLENYDAVVLHCSNALEIEPNNAKGLYRRASANLALNKHKAAHTDLVILLKDDPNNVLANHLMKRVEAKFQAESKQERETYQRIFASLEQPDTPPLYNETNTDVSNPTEPKKAAPSKSFLSGPAMAAIAVLVLLLAFLFSKF